MPSSTFPRTFYDRDGPEYTPELEAGLPFKALIRDRPGTEEVAKLQAGDRLWILPDGPGSPPTLPTPLFVDLGDVVRRGRQFALVGSDTTVFASMRDALLLLLNEPGGQA